MIRTLILAASAVGVAVAGAAHLGGGYGAVHDVGRAMQVARQEFARRGAAVDGPLKVTHTNGVWRVARLSPADPGGEVYIRDDGRVPSINPRTLKLVPVVENRPPDEAMAQETWTGTP